MEPTRFSARLEDTRELGQAVGFELEFRQLSYGRQATVAEYLVGEHVVVVDVSFNRAFHQLGYAPPGFVTVGIPYEGVRRWFGRDCDSQIVLPFNQASGFDCVSNPDFSGWTLSVNEPFLQTIADTCGLPYDDRLWRPDSGSFISDSAETRSLCELMRVCTRRSSGLLNPALEERIAIALLATASGADTSDKSGPAARTNALSAALEYFRYHEHEPVKVREICVSTGVASRTLERAFKENFGIGPKAYQQRLRLNSVREALLAVGGDAVIADIANHWGFWHMGQFAKDYKALFGELPSETLAGRNR